MNLESHALVEQLKAQIRDNLRGFVCVDPTNMEAYWTKKMVEDALLNSIPKTGVDSYEIGDPFQPTYEQYLDYVEGRLFCAIDRVHHAVVYSPDDVEDEMEDYIYWSNAHRHTLVAVAQHGAHTKVPDMMMGNVNIKPTTPVESVEITFILDPDLEV